MSKKTKSPINTSKFKDLCQVLKLLSGSPRCLQVCLFLAKQAATVTEIVNHCEANQPAISHYLQYLRVRGLISGSREGKYIRYTASPELTSLVSSLSVLLEEAA
jgi:DNA-binding transcriptional ArsR family regulator